METLAAASACHVLALKSGEMIRYISMVQIGILCLLPFCRTKLDNQFWL